MHVVILGFSIIVCSRFISRFSDYIYYHVVRGRDQIEMGACNLNHSSVLNFFDQLQRCDVIFEPCSINVTSVNMSLFIHDDL